MTALRKLRLAETPEDALTRLTAERVKAVEALARIDTELSETARAWGEARGYRVRVSPEQMRRELAYRNAVPLDGAGEGGGS